MKHRFIRIATLAVCLVIIGGVVATSSASASNIDDKRAQAAQLQREIEANGEQISMLAERYDGAQLRLDDARQNIARVEARLEAARAETVRIGGVASRRAAAVHGRRRAVADRLDERSDCERGGKSVRVRGRRR